jgi:Ca-activated chloride channel family protein
MMTGLLFSAIMAQEPASQPPVGPEVSLSVIVTDRSNHSVDDLRQEAFQLLENKVPQTITVFQKDERPVSFVIAMDASGSFKPILGPALNAARMLLEGNRTSDQTSLIRFVSSDQIETFSDFTSDKAALIDRLKLFKIGMGQSAVIDAIHIAVKTAADHNVADSSVRRAVVLISDGEDRASYYNADALVQLLRRTPVQVFIIGILNKLDDERGLIRASPRAVAEALLKRVAEESGGRVFFPRDDREMLRAADEISHDLRTQYKFTYQSSNPSDKESSRKIEIKTVKSQEPRSLTVITRPRYFVNRPEPTERKKSKE